MRAEKITGIYISSFGNPNAPNFTMTLPRNKVNIVHKKDNNVYRRSANGTLLIDAKLATHTLEAHFDYMPLADYYKLYRILLSNDSSIPASMHGQITTFSYGFDYELDGDNPYVLMYWVCTKFPDPKIIDYEIQGPAGIIFPDNANGDGYRAYAPILGDINFTLESM